MVDPFELHGDCGRCVGLCCVALAFDRGPAFAEDKPADVACKNLLPIANRCAIHHRRAAAGFGGCVHYDCLGAGQHVTARFAGRPRDAAMLEAFRRRQEAQRLLLLLDEARKLPLDAAREGVRARLTMRVDREEAPADRLSAEVHAFLRSLRGLWVSPRASSARE